MQAPLSAVPNATNAGNVANITTVDKCTLLIQLLHEGVTKELLFKEFKKYGGIKNLKHFPKTKSAQVQFDTPEEAAQAKREMNHKLILSKEINIVNYQSKDDLKLKKKFNLFIKNVPEDLETKVLHNYMQSEFGDIASLLLKKNDQNKNLGYGYVQFESKQAYDKVLEAHQKENKITVKNSNFSFNVEQFNDSNKNKLNIIHINGLYENEVTSGIEEKNKYIQGVIEEVKQKLSFIKHFSHHTQYNESKKNFWVNIDFSYTNEDDEEKVFQEVKKIVKEKFSYSNSNNGPTINFKSMESSEKNLILLGIKKTLKENDIANWIKKAINVDISAENIKIKMRTPKPATNAPNTQPKIEESTYFCTVFFDSKKDGEKLMIYCANRANQQDIESIFEVRHKVTLYLKRGELEEIKKQTSKMSEYTNSNNINQNSRVSYDVMQPQIHPMFNRPFGAFFPPNMIQVPANIPRQTGKPLPPVQHEKNLTHPITAPKTQPPQQNIFMKFLSQSQEEKRNYIERVAQAIQTEKAEFDKIEENNQRGILGQIIYYKIQNIDISKNPNIVSYLGVGDIQQATIKIDEFKNAVAKITGMLIDLEVFNISDIIDIVKDEKELIERCSEAIELINQKN